MDNRKTPTKTPTTRQKRILAIGACAFVCTVVLVVCLSGPREPEYQGKKLSEWVSELQTGWNPGSRTEADSEQYKRARNAILEIGTNGIPFLLVWIKYEPNRFNVLKYRACALLRLNVQISLSTGTKSRHRLAYGAEEAFELLGTRGRSAAPELKKIVRHCPESAQRAAMALFYVGGSDPEWFANFIHTP